MDYNDNPFLDPTRYDPQIGDVWESLIKKWPLTVVRVADGIVTYTYGNQREPRDTFEKPTREFCRRFRFVRPA
jgi:hypothetical protein